MVRCRRGAGTGPHWPGLGAAMTAGALLPRTAYAADVGCFCTAVFVSFMLMVCMGMTTTGKHILAKRMAPVSWKKNIGLSFIELFTIILLFVLIQKGYFLSLIVYFPIALGMNILALGRQAASADPPRQRSKIMLQATLMSLVLPLSLQVSGVLFKMISELMTFRELRV